MRSGRLFAFILPGLTLLLAGLIVTDWVPGLRGPAPGTSEWYWPYVLRPLSRWWPSLVAAAVFWLFCVWWLRQPQRRRVIIIGLLGLVLFSLLMQLSLLYADRPAITAELVDRTLADQQNGYFVAAANTNDLTTLLRDFPQLMPTFPSEHSRTHPPGLILLNWLIIQSGDLFLPLAASVPSLRCTDLWLLNQSPPTMAALLISAFLPLLAAALTSIPLYFLSKKLYGDKIGRLAAILGTMLPALLIFAPMPDQLFALLSTVTLLTGYVAWQRGSIAYAGLTGFLLSLSTFFSLGNGALLFLLALIALWYFYRQRSLPPVLWLGSFAVGLASVWLIYWLGWGVAPWAVAPVALQQHYELVTLWRRYDWWVVYNLVDLIVFVGPIIMLGFSAALVVNIRQLFSTRKTAVDALVLGLGLLIFVLDLSGSTRGEVGRLWLLFMPFLALAAATYLAARLTATWQIPLLLAAQLILVLSLGLAWKPIEAVIVAIQRPDLPALAVPEHKLAVPFGDSIQLVGYDWQAAQLAPEDTINFTLYWQGTADRPYTVFTHLLNQNGELVAQKDNWPVAGQWPPTCWQAEEVITDPYAISLPADLAVGTYTLLIGLYDANDGTRLITADGQDTFPLSDLLIGP